MYECKGYKERLFYALLLELMKYFFAHYIRREILHIHTKFGGPNQKTFLSPLLIVITKLKRKVVLTVLTLFKGVDRFI